MPVRHSQGTYHAFLLLLSEAGKELAVGDLVQVAHGTHVQSRLTFHFRDGSLDDDKATYTQSGSFRLVHDHHIQRGPSFPRPLDLEIDVPSGQVMNRAAGDGGKGSVTKEKMDLPPDLYNGLSITILTNISPRTPKTRISMLVVAGKPRLIHLDITPDGQDRFSIGPSHRTADRFRAHYDLGGFAAIVAPIFGKQPDDILVDVLSGDAPAFIRFTGQLYQGGPTWHIEVTSPRLPK